jgi:hypothetical protein
MVKKVDPAMIVPFPSIMMIHPIIPADENRPAFLRTRQKAAHAELQKFLLWRAI